jgi:hypothetical protein
MGINTWPYPATNILHPPAYEDGTDKEFRNVGYQDPDAGESPKKEQSTIDTWRKLENKIVLPPWLYSDVYCKSMHTLKDSSVTVRLLAIQCDLVKSGLSKFLKC